MGADRKRSKREKMDSGLGEEIIEKDTVACDSSDDEGPMDMDSSCNCTDDDEPYENMPRKRSSRLCGFKTDGKLRRITFATQSYNDGSSSEEEDNEPIPDEPNRFFAWNRGGFWGKC